MRLVTVSFCAWLAVACAQRIGPLAGAETLQPAQSLKVAPDGWKMRDVRIDGDDVWALVQAPEGNFSILRTSLAGRQTGRFDFPAAERVLGIVATNSGAAAMVARERRLSLDRFDKQGKPLGQTQLQCASGDHLLSLGGEAATICPDGQITRHSPSQAPVRLTSWARPGSLTEALSGQRLVIADRMTGKLLFNDLTSGGLSAPAQSSPEVAQAVAHIDGVMKTASTKPGDPPPVRSLVLMDTATDGKSVALLIWPFHPDVGVGVVIHAGDGSVQRRLACPLPPQLRNAIPHKLEMTASLLAIGTTDGQLVTYRYKE